MTQYEIKSYEMASSKMAKKVKLQTRRKKPFIRLLSNALGQKYL